MKTTMNIIYLASAFIALACLTLSASAQLPPPPPVGGYPHRNTATGDGALTNVTTGGDNTAIGFNTLHAGSSAGNTAIGADALAKNTSIGIKFGHDNTATGQAALWNNTVGTFNTADGRGCARFEHNGRQKQRVWG